MHRNAVPFMQQPSLPSIQSERLLFRRLQPADDKAIFALRNNEQVNAFIQRPLLDDISDAQHFIASINKGIKQQQWQYWAILLKTGRQLIGTICFWHFSHGNTIAEIGYELHPDFQGMGLMNEALQTIITYGFDTLQLQTITAYTQPENVKSVKLLKLNHFVQDIIPDTSCNSREIRFVRTRQPL